MDYTISILGIDEVNCHSVIGHMEYVLFVNVPKENLGSGSVYATMHCRKVLSSLGEICFFHQKSISSCVICL